MCLYENVSGNPNTNKTIQKKPVMYTICCMGKPNTGKEKHSTANRLLSLVVLQPKSGLGHRHTHPPTHTHTNRHTHTHTKRGDVLWKRDQPTAAATTCTTHNKHMKQTSMFSVAFEPAMPAIKRRKFDALNSTAIGVCNGLLIAQN